MAPQDPVLLLHGMGCGPWVWSEVTSHLAGVAVMPVHLAGHRGGVPLDPRSGLSAAEQMVEDLERRLDRAGVDRAHVVGNSLGGGTAVRLALDHPGRAGRLVLMAPGGLGVNVFAPDPTEGIKKLYAFGAPPGPSKEKLAEFLRTLVFDQKMITDELVDERYQYAAD
ncbi:MAG TPA: alpha/beta fold hydrolase, partial [Nocardioides sp.]|nr:alpha/beta fold hydrolase [Nocardioides sp.]